MDVWEGGIRQIEHPPRDPDCPACARRDFAYLEGRAARAGRACAGATPCRSTSARGPWTWGGSARALSPLGEVRANEFALRFLPHPYEMTIFPDGRAIIKGTTDIGIARSLYAKYLGS